MRLNATKAENEAIKFGVDIELIDYNLGLSFEDRLIQHQGALDLVFSLIEASEVGNSKSKQAIKNIPR